MYRKAYVIVMVALLAMFALMFVLLYKQLKQLNDQRHPPRASSPAR